MKRRLRFCLFAVMLLLAALPCEAQLTGGFTASDVSGCIGLQVTFTADTNGSPTNFSWSLGNGSSPPNSATVTTTYATAGPFTVTLTASNATGSATTSTTIQVYAKPVVSFTGTPTTICVQQAVNFTSTVTKNSPGQETYDWDFGDNTMHSTAANPQHIYQQSGNFDVNLLVTNGAGCSKLSTKPLYVHVNALPVPTFTVSPLYSCTSPATFTFTNTTSGPVPFTNTWDWGDGSPTVTNGLSPITHPYTNGAYQVTLRTTDGNGCASIGPSTPQLVSVYGAKASFSGPGTACQNALVTFTNTTPGGTGYMWDYGDGVSDGSGQHAYTMPGTYMVKFSVNIGPCPKLDSAAIIIKPTPIPVVTFSPQRPCPGSVANPSPVTFTVTTTPPGANITWTNFGDNTSGSGNPVTHNYTINGYKTIHFIATSAGCPTDDIELKDFVPINGLSAKINSGQPDSGCVGDPLNFQVFLYGTLPPAPNPPLYPDPANSWNWIVNDPSNPPVPYSTPTISYTKSSVGNYTVSVTGTTPNGVSGCPYTATLDVVHVDSKILADFTTSPKTVCVNTPVTFTNLTVNNAASNTLTTYAWNTGDSAFTTPVSPTSPAWIPGFTHSYKIPGKQTTTLTVNHNGCRDQKIRNDSIIVNPPNARFDFQLSCPPTYTVYFNNTSVGATSWLWDFGDGSPITSANSLANPQHSYAGIGTYIVKLHTANSTSGCTDDTSRPVIIFDPTLTIVANHDTVCLGQDITFTGNFVGVGAATYSWKFDTDPPTTPTSDPFITQTFATRGAHTVKLIVAYGNACVATLTKSKDVLVAQPAANFTASPVIGCAPLSVTFTDASTPVPGTTIKDRDWDFGDLTYDAGNNTISPPPHIYNAARDYDLKLTVTDNKGCKEILTRTAFIKVRRPVATFIGKTPVCVHTVDSFTNNSIGATPLSYYWDFGDGTTSRAKNIGHTYNTPGIYTVRLIAIDSTPCADTMRLSVTVVGPTASFTKDKKAAICPPLVVSFTNTSVNASFYSWNMGNGTTLSTLAPQNYTYGISGKYIIALTATDANGCADIARDSVFVLGDSSSFSYTPVNGCVPQIVFFKAVVDSVPRIRWDFNDGIVETRYNTDTITHIYYGNGPYTPIAYFSDGTPNCNTPAPAGTPIRIDKVKADFTTSVPCVGVPFSLTNSSTAVYSNPTILRWLFTATDSAGGANPSYTYATSGPHAVRLIATNGWGCSDTLTKNVFINPLPNIDAGPPDTGICPGDQILLIGHGGVSYVWSPANLVSCTVCDTTLVSSAAPTTYYLTGTDANGCINHDSITAHIQIKTTTSVKPGGDICIGESYRLEATGATIYSWSPERFVDSPHISSPLATPIITTSYVVAAQEGTCLIRYDTVTVVVHPTPYFDAGPDEIIDYGASITLHPTKGGIKSIEWRTDSTLSCFSCFEPVAHPTFSTIYYAKAMSEYGCIATDSLFVRVKCNGDSVFIPNTFTPNGDGLNDFFYPRGKGIDHISVFRIFNRWGEMVYEHFTMPLNDEKSGWDGTFKGKQLPPDVYVYTMTTRCENGEPVSWKGDITLVR